MKTITIKQPWASLIVKGIKDIENRTWPTKFRGRVLIHSGIENLFDKTAFYDDVLSAKQINEIVRNKKFDDIFGKHLHTSAIIGSVEIVDCVQNHSSKWAEPSFDLFVEGDKEPIKSERVYNWVLDKPVMFDTPITGVKGRLSFWEYELPESYIQEIERKLSHE